MELRPSASVAASGIFEDVGVDLLYRYEGLPADNIFRIPFMYDIQPEEGGWVFTAASLPATLPPWASGPVEVSRTVHFLALFRPGTPEVASILQMAEQARASLTPRVTEPLEPAHLMVLARGRADYEQMTSSPAPVSSVAQAETTFEVTPDMIAVRSRHIVVDLQALSRQPSPLEVLSHELGHLSLSRLNRPFLPGWVGESAAMYLAEQRPEATWRFGAANGRFRSLSFEDLSGQMNLGTHDPSLEGANLAYAYAAAAAYWLVETYGSEPYWSFYADFSEVPARDVYALLPQGEADPPASALSELARTTTADALRDNFGVGFDALDQGVRGWILRR